MKCSSKEMMKMVVCCPRLSMYLSLSGRGSVVICPTQRNSYILALGFLGKPSFRTASHFPAP
jgi:hypothetical protein